MKKSEPSHSGQIDLNGLKSDPQKQKITISVIGGHEVDAKTETLAENVGKMIAQFDAILICGGLDGVMKAAARGCQQAGGLTIGLLPGKEKSDANPYIVIALPTTIGFARNAMVACCADLIIALPGSFGTSSEISYGMVYKRPIIDLGGWGLKGMLPARNLEDAQKIIAELIPNLRQGGK